VAVWFGGGEADDWGACGSWCVCVRHVAPRTSVCVGACENLFSSIAVYENLRSSTAVCAARHACMPGGDARAQQGRAAGVARG
jgi:hypothetical protein